MLLGECGVDRHNWGVCRDDMASAALTAAGAAIVSSATGFDHGGLIEVVPWLSGRPARDFDHDGAASGEQ